jgi:transporter family protein
MNSSSNPWFLFTFVSLLLWGAWGFFSKLAAISLKPTDAYIYQVVGILLAGVAMAFLVRFDYHGKTSGILFGLASGAAVTFGAYFFFQALGRGRGGVVVTATALYPVITLLLSSVFLHESFSLKQVLGIGFALVAIYLLAA